MSRPAEFETHEEIGLRKLRDYGGCAVLSEAEAKAVVAVVEERDELRQMSLRNAEQNSITHELAILLGLRL